MATMDIDNQTQPIFDITDLDWSCDDDHPLDLVVTLPITQADLTNRGVGGTHDAIFGNETQAIIKVYCCLDHDTEFPYATVSVVTKLDKVFYSDYRGHKQLFDALFGAENTQKFAREFAQENALKWSDLPDFQGSYPVSIEEIHFPILVTNPPKGVSEQHKAVLDPSDENHTEVSIEIAPWGPTITITTPDGEYNSYKNPEKMHEFFGADWQEELDCTLENL